MQYHLTHDPMSLVLDGLTPSAGGPKSDYCHQIRKRSASDPNCHNLTGRQVPTNFPSAGPPSHLGFMKIALLHCLPLSIGIGNLVIFQTGIQMSEACLAPLRLLVPGAEGSRGGAPCREPLGPLT